MNTKASLKLIILTLLLLATLPLGIYTSISKLNAIKEDTRTINAIGYIRGSSQRIIKESFQNDRDSIVQEVQKRFAQIETDFIQNNRDHLHTFEFRMHYAQLNAHWTNLLSSLNTKGDSSSLNRLSEACWKSADKATMAVEEISNLKHTNTVWTIVIIGTLIFVLLLFTLHLIHVEVKDQLEKNIVLDPLTRLYNRYFFLDVIKKRIKVFNRDRKPFSLLFIDIDHFKQINDTFGHNTGDKTLKELSSLFKRNLRGDDIAFRYGGEEFVILAMNDCTQKAYELAERLRKLVEKHDFGLKDTLTISIGICEFDEDGDLDNLLKQADQAMYEAKSRGRNQSIIFSKERS